VQRDVAGRKLACPKSHGTWTYVADAPVEGTARRKQVSKGGFTTKPDAEAALREFLSQADRGLVVLPRRRTLADYLARWLAALGPGLAPTAASSYQAMARLHVLPQLGGHRLSTLRPHHLVDAYRRLLLGGGKNGRSLSPTTVRTVHRILNKGAGSRGTRRCPRAKPCGQLAAAARGEAGLQVWGRSEMPRDALAPRPLPGPIRDPAPRCQSTSPSRQSRLPTRRYRVARLRAS
jgi:hypothetical protein